MNTAVPRVSIGLPTYNRPELLALVLDCFRQQTFTDFELVISDNASPDPSVRELCKRYVKLDPRFRYVRQPSNIGGERNFWFVYDQAKAPFFLWASDDDLWPADFLERGVAALDANRWASSWFCQVVNINTNGDVIRSYPSFSRFRSSAFKFVDLARYLWEPEIMGKANLIYSLFRREALKEAVDMFRERPPTWGNDMNLVYGHLCRSNLLIDDQIVLRKRIPAERAEPIGDPRSLVIPPEWHEIYFQNYRRAAWGSGYWSFTAAVLWARSAYDYWYSGEARKELEYWERRLLGAGRKLWRAFQALAKGG